MVNKTLITIQVLDFLGNPVQATKYQVKNKKTGQLIAEGGTDKTGCITQISRNKGTILDIYLKSIIGNNMVNVKTIELTKDRMLVKIYSPKLLLNFSTALNKGSNGDYQRKPYVVKSGDTLSSIAKLKKTTVRALINANNIKDPDKLSVGQVIKVPVNIPATGNHTHTNPTTPKPSKAKQSPSSATNTNTEKNFSEKLLEATEAANQWLEEQIQKAKDLAATASKIIIQDDRSQQGGTPKANAQNLCLKEPQCITSGSSDLIKEVNVRLAGFGGALPTSEFTELTANCIKQFQRDYMGVPETGKICGSVLAALDKFYDEYPIAGFMNKASCPCGKCKGFGNGNMGVKSGSSIANEFPGIHRSLIWILKALNFYLKNEYKDKKLEVAYIESGYRCIERNKQQKRTSVNHMGLALDIHFNKNGVRTRELVDMEYIRKQVMAVKMSAVEQRASNKIYLEPKVFNNGDAGATAWVHFDLTRFSNNFFDNIFFGKTVQTLNGVKLLALTANLGFHELLACSGIAKLQQEPIDNNKNIDELIKELGDVIASGEGSYEAWNAGAPEGERVKYGRMNDKVGTITGRTINELIRCSEIYLWTDNRRRFATGKYQTIPTTLKAAKTKMGLTGNESYDADMQEKVFRDFLVIKQPLMKSFIQDGNVSVDKAMVGASREWASIALPKGEINKFGVMSDGTIGYHQSRTNRANVTSTAKVRAILEKIEIIHKSKKG